MGTTADKLNKLLETKTAIKNAIIARGVEIADTDTFASYADKIKNISGGSQTKYGVSIDNILGEVDENGVLQIPSAFSWIAKDITDIGDKVFQYKFYETNITSISFPNLSTISGNYACFNMSNSCAQLTNVDLGALTIISGSEACRGMFQGCANLMSANLSNLTTISGDQACRNMFYNCATLGNVNLSNLTTIDSTASCQYMFYGCKGLTRVDFSSLTTVTNTNALSAMFSGCSNLKELHFRSDAQSMIEGLANYSSKFGASSSTIYFDL